MSEDKQQDEAPATPASDPPAASAQGDGDQGTASEAPAEGEAPTA